MADVLILAAGTAAAPAAYEVPNAQVILPKAVHAVFNGSGASGSFVPVLEIVSDAGIAVATCPLGSTIAAGGAAEVSWFPCAALTPETTSGLAVTEVLYLNPTVASQSAATVLATGTTYLLSVQGTYSLWNTALATGVPEAAPMFPPASSAGRVSTQVGLDADTTFAIQFGSGVPIGHNPTFQIDLGGGFAHVEPAGGPYTTPQATHYYTYSVVGQGSAPQFRINDVNPPDNYGELKITIYGGPGGGGVVGVAPGDASVVAGGSASAVTLKTASLDVIAGLHPTGADWSNNSRKITTVTDPTNPQDAATKNYVDGLLGGGGITSIASAAGSVAVTNPLGPATNLEVAASGVAAATYGSSSTVPQLAVDATGRITSASNVALTGGGASVRLFTATLLADTAAIDTDPTSLAGYDVLEVWVYARTDEAVVNSGVAVIFNNDTGANYDHELVQSSNATVTGTNSAGATAVNANVTGALAGANVFTVVQFALFNYAGTVGNKSGTLFSGVPDTTAINQRVVVRHFEYRNTAAITRIKVTPATVGKLLKDGSRMIVYGR